MDVAESNTSGVSVSHSVHRVNGGEYPSPGHCICHVWLASGWYVSYWNAFLLVAVSIKIDVTYNYLFFLKFMQYSVQTCRLANFVFYEKTRPRLIQYPLCIS